MKIKVVLPIILTAFLLTGCNAVERIKQRLENLELPIQREETVDFDKAEGVLTDALANRDFELVAEIAAEYAKTGEMTRVDTLILSEIQALLSDDAEYEDYQLAENLLEELYKSDYDGELTEKIEKLLDEKETDKLKATLQGIWVRRDSSSLNGSKIEVSFSKTSGKAVLKYASANPYGFVEGDIKWKDIELFGEDNFSFNDLGKSSDTAMYKPVNATLNYDDMTITVNISDVQTDGTKQKWVKSGYQSINNAEVDETVNSDEYLYPSDRKYITEQELDNYSRDEVALIRNEIYARHGYIFKTESYNVYFSSKSWYTPNANFSESMLNDIERTNREFIVSYEEKRGWR